RSRAAERAIVGLRSCSVFDLGLAKHEERAAELDHRTVADEHPTCELAVDHGAILGARVIDKPAIGRAKQSSMLTGHRGIGNRDVQNPAMVDRYPARRTRAPAEPHLLDVIEEPARGQLLERIAAREQYKLWARWMRRLANLVDRPGACVRALVRRATSPRH